MVEVADIVDEESLRAWIGGRPEETRQADALAIASRAVLRVVPLFISQMKQDWVRITELTALPILRSIFTVGVARIYPSHLVKQAAYSNASSAIYGAYEFAASASVSAADPGASAADSVISAGNSVAWADSVLSASASLEEVRLDAVLIESGQEPFQKPLWVDNWPEWASTNWSAGRSWLTNNPGHDFWIRWYEATREGRPLTGDWDCHWQMLRDIALIPNEDWEQGAEHVARLIAAIENPYALAMTASNERVVISE